MVAIKVVPRRLNILLLSRFFRSMPQPRFASLIALRRDTAAPAPFERPTSNRRPVRTAPPWSPLAMMAFAVCLAQLTLCPIFA